ncbi:hypothetical protein EJ02DRAFT_14883 [Clathrospora elynae]|uniref:Uncharacterized protein n=1 Tax=Clathrospora elynae TaxID=706981 RepID=A0A6A5T5G6_9PLEO|nr:hypothetical protein EJ02DRAFT_14883 [Clathrospora elynae]
MQYRISHCKYNGKPKTMARRQKAAAAGHINLRHLPLLLFRNHYSLQLKCIRIRSTTNTRDIRRLKPQHQKRRRIPLSTTQNRTQQFQHQELVSLCLPSLFSSRFSSTLSASPSWPSSPPSQLPATSSSTGSRLQASPLFRNSSRTTHDHFRTMSRLPDSMPLHIPHQNHARRSDGQQLANRSVTSFL